MVGPSEAVPRAVVDTEEPAIPTPRELTAAPAPATQAPSATPVPARPRIPARAEAVPLHVVALGDSVTDGTNCGCVPFPELYAAGLRDRYGAPVRITNDGFSGATSSDILDELANDGTGVSTADVVVVTIGANDFSDVSEAVLSASCGGHDNLRCTSGGLTQLQHHLRSIVSSIRALDRAESTAVLLTGYWNVYEDGNVADADYSAAGRAASVALTRQVNQVIKATAVDTGATYVDLFAPFKAPPATRTRRPCWLTTGTTPARPVTGSSPKPCWPHGSRRAPAEAVASSSPRCNNSLRAGTAPASMAT